MFKAFTFKFALNTLIWIINSQEDTVMDWLRVDPDIRKLIDAGTDYLGKLVGRRILELGGPDNLDKEFERAKRLFQATLIEAKAVQELDDMHKSLADGVIIKPKPVIQLPTGEIYVWDALKGGYRLSGKE